MVRPSLSTLLKGKQGVHGAYALVHRHTVFYTIVQVAQSNVLCVIHFEETFDMI